MNIERHANLIMEFAANGESVGRIAERLGLDVATVRRLISRHAWDHTEQHYNLPEYEPTPEQIRTTCLAIQSGWDDIERQRRTVTHNPAAAIPQVSAFEATR